MVNSIRTSGPNVSESLIENIHFHSSKCIWKCLENWDHYVWICYENNQAGLFAEITCAVVGKDYILPWTKRREVFVNRTVNTRPPATFFNWVVQVNVLHKPHQSQLPCHALITHICLSELVQQWLRKLQLQLIAFNTIQPISRHFNSNIFLENTSPLSTSTWVLAAMS